MRPVKDGLHTPYGEVEESERGEPVDLLCSSNAWEEEGSLVVPLLAERAPSEGPRSTRAFEDRPGHPSKRETSKLGGITYPLTQQPQ